MSESAIQERAGSLYLLIYNIGELIVLQAPAGIYQQFGR